MKLYLSSFKIGNTPQQLLDLLPENKRTIYISNGLDFAREESRQKHQQWDMKELQELGLNPEHIDLRKYFGREEELRTLMEGVGLIYVSGGNVYDLRLAMHLSGFDTILKEMKHNDLVYGGYSAAVCVLSPTLRGYHIVDDPNHKIYGDYETMWEGLEIIDWQFAPHVDSAHEESEDINKEIEYYKANAMITDQHHHLGNDYFVYTPALDCDADHRVVCIYDSWTVY